AVAAGELGILAGVVATGGRRGRRGRAQAVSRRQRVAGGGGCFRLGGRDRVRQLRQTPLDRLRDRAGGRSRRGEVRRGRRRLVTRRGAALPVGLGAELSHLVVGAGREEEGERGDRQQRPGRARKPARESEVLQW